MYESPAISLNSGLNVMYSNGCGSVDVTSVVSSVVVLLVVVALIVAWGEGKKLKTLQSINLECYLSSFAGSWWCAVSLALESWWWSLSSLSWEF